MKKQALSVALSAFLTSSALAAPSLTPVVTNDQAFGGTLPSGFVVGGFGAVGPTIYAFASSNNTSGGRITAGLPGTTFTPIIAATALENQLGPVYVSGLSPNGEVLTVGSKLVIPDSLNGGVITLDTAASNQLTLVLSSTQIRDASGATDTTVRRPSGAGIAPNGDLIFFDSDSDSDALLSSNLTAGNVNLLASSATLGAFADFDGGTVAGNSYYGVGSDFDTIVKADFNINTGQLDPSTFAPIFTTEEYEAIIDPTDTSPSLLPREMITGDDGLIYFYDGDVDGVVSFDPNDPLATLRIAVTEDMLLSAIGSDNVTDLLFYDGKLHVVAGNTGTGGLYALVPEPASLSLLALGGLALRRRR